MAWQEHSTARHGTVWHGMAWRATGHQHLPDYAIVLLQSFVGSPPTPGPRAHTPLKSKAVSQTTANLRVRYVCVSFWICRRACPSITSFARPTLPSCMSGGVALQDDHRLSNNARHVCMLVWQAHPPQAVAMHATQPLATSHTSHAPPQTPPACSVRMPPAQPHPCPARTAWPALGTGRIRFSGRACKQGESMAGLVQASMAVVLSSNGAGCAAMCPCAIMKAIPINCRSTPPLPSSRDQRRRVLGQCRHCTRLQQADQHVLLQACHLQGARWGGDSTALDCSTHSLNSRPT